MKVLVVFDLVTENIYQTVVEMTNDEYQYFSPAHGKIANVDVTDEKESNAISTISNAFATNPQDYKYCETDIDKEYFGKWKNNPKLTDISDVDRFIFCGFML